MMMQVQEDSRGFTLVEVLVSMVIALVLLAGVVGVFISQHKSANMVQDKTDRLSDLFLASQMMQAEFRQAQAVCWDATNKRIVYQPLDSASVVSDPCTGTVNSANGFFRFDAATSSQTASICWDRPNQGGGCQELLRDLKDTTGLQVSPTSNADLGAVRKVTLTARSQDFERVDQDVSLEFDVWPRN